MTCVTGKDVANKKLEGGKKPIKLCHEILGTNSGIKLRILAMTADVHKSFIFKSQDLCENFILNLKRL